MMKGFVFAALIGGACTGALAQTDVLYVTDAYSTARLNRFQGGNTLSQTGMVTSGESALAVAGDVRTMPPGGGTGYQYSLAGSYTGTSYSWNGPGSWYDGTTDGSHNYSVAYSSGQVYSFDRNWQSPSYMFTTNNNGGFGITYDSKDNALWVTNTSTGLIEKYSMGGSYMGAIGISGYSAFAGLAYEPSTDTLWLAGSGNGYYQQYNKTTGFIQNVTPSSLSGPVGYYGAEFDVPAPGSFALLGLGGFAAARRRRM